MTEAAFESDRPPRIPAVHERLTQLHHRVAVVGLELEGMLEQGDGLLRSKAIVGLPAQLIGPAG